MEKYQDTEEMIKLSEESNKILSHHNLIINSLEKRAANNISNIEIKDGIVKAYIKNKEKQLGTMAKSSLNSVQEHAKKLNDEWDYLRKTTVPYNYLWYWFIVRKQYKKLPLSMQRGVHFIVALMGGGKSSFIYHTIERLRNTFGYSAYVNVDLEYAHYDPLLKEYVMFHKKFEQTDYWGPVENAETGKIEFQQLKRFNKLYPILVLDEWLSKMNHRMNNTSNYKELFIPFMKSLTHIRHQGIHHVYVASQLDTTDIQLMGLFKYLHEVEIDLDISYKLWVETGKLDKHVMGWMVHTYTMKRKKGKTDKILMKSWYEFRTMDMTNFNSLNQEGEYKSLPYDDFKIKRSVV